MYCLKLSKGLNQLIPPIHTSDLQLARIRNEVTRIRIELAKIRIGVTGIRIEVAEIRIGVTGIRIEVT